MALCIVSLLKLLGWLRVTHSRHPSVFFAGRLFVSQDEAHTTYSTYTSANYGLSFLLSLFPFIRFRIITHSQLIHNHQATHSTLNFPPPPLFFLLFIFGPFFMARRSRQSVFVSCLSHFVHLYLPSCLSYPSPSSNSFSPRSITPVAHQIFSSHESVYPPPFKLSSRFLSFPR